MLTDPFEAEDARDLQRELAILPRRRPQRGDPGVEILRDQASTELPSHLPPDGVEHPPIPRCSDRRSDFSRCRHAALSTRGENSRNPPSNKPFMRAILVDTCTPPGHPHVFGGTASNPSPEFIFKKAICRGRRCL